MAVVEAVLVYRLPGLTGEESMTIARTAHPEVLRVLRDRLLEEAGMWSELDPSVGAI